MPGPGVRQRLSHAGYVENWANKRFGADYVSGFLYALDDDVFREPDEPTERFHEGREDGFAVRARMFGTKWSKSA